MRQVQTGMVAMGFAALASVAQGGLLVDVPFNYPDGNLVGNGGWVAFGTHTAAPVQVVGGAARLVHGTGSRQDVSHQFATIGGGTTLFAAFDLVKSGVSTNVGFAGFRELSTTTQYSRVWITAGGGGDYRLGISHSGLLGTGTLPVDLFNNLSYRVVVSYNYDTGDQRLWVNPVDESSTRVDLPGVAGRPFAHFGLWQHTDSTSTQLIDNLMVGTSFGEVIPAPGTMALLGMGGIAAARRRRA